MRICTAPNFIPLCLHRDSDEMLTYTQNHYARDEMAALHVSMIAAEKDAL